ncbi:LuxR C-terminal-related transcriptional regulator, partial [Conexibacter sp. JD483]
PGERADLHGRAAARLSARGARLEEIAAHLLAAEPGSSPETVATLREAARAAAAEGAPDTAVAYLRRALREQPAAAGIAQGEAAGIAQGEAAGIAQGEAAGIAQGEAAGIAQGKAAGVAQGEGGVARGGADGIARGGAGGIAPAAADRAGLLLELGELEVLVGAPEGVGRLGEAIASAGLGDDALARARASRARVRVLAEPAAAVSDLEAAVATARDPRLKLQLESSLLDATAYVASLRTEREALLHAPGEPSIVRKAHLLTDSAYRCRPIGETEALAREVIGSRELLDAVGSASGTYNLVTIALRHAELRDLADGALQDGERSVRRSGSRLGLAVIEHARALWQLTFGSLGAGEAYARAALATMEELRLALSVVSTETVLSEFLRERGALDEAAERIEAVALPPGAEGTIVYPDFLSARAMVRWTRGGREAAESDLRAARAALLAGGWRAPLKSLASIRLIALLAERGERDEAMELAAEEEAIARGIGTPGALGSVLHVRARALGGEEGLELLTEATRLLRDSPLLLQTGWAQHDLGATLRRARRRADAREPLREALDLARRIGATRLADSAREELLASGARPRREALSGVEALTPSERRVAALAAEGMSNREIAETLWVTRKTVELHLGNVYAKLGIRRAQLADALTGAEAPAEPSGASGVETPAGRD